MTAVVWAQMNVDHVIIHVVITHTTITPTTLLISRLISYVYGKSKIRDEVFRVQTATDRLITSAIYRGLDADTGASKPNLINSSPRRYGGQRAGGTVAAEGRRVAGARGTKDCVQAGSTVKTIDPPDLLLTPSPTDGLTSVRPAALKLQDRKLTYDGNQTPQPAAFYCPRIKS